MMGVVVQPFRSIDPRVQQGSSTRRRRVCDHLFFFAAVQLQFYNVLI